RTGGEVSGRAIGGLHPDLPRPVQLRRVRVQGPFSLPIVEDARRLLLLLRRFAPVSRRQGAILLPRAAGQLQRAVAISRDPQEAHGGWLPRAAFRQGELPPEPLDAGDAALVLDRLPKLLVDDSHLGSGRRLAVPYTGQAEEILGSFAPLAWTMNVRLIPRAPPK